MASICQLLNLPEIPDRRHISLPHNSSSPSVSLEKRTLFELSTTLRDDRSCSHAYMQPRYEHAHFLPQYWSGQNRTSRTACAGPAIEGHGPLPLSMEFPSWMNPLPRGNMGTSARGHVHHPCQRVGKKEADDELEDCLCCSCGYHQPSIAARGAFTAACHCMQCHLWLATRVTTWLPASCACLHERVCPLLCLKGFSAELITTACAYAC